MNSNSLTIKTREYYKLSKALEYSIFGILIGMSALKILARLFVILLALIRFKSFVSFYLILVIKLITFIRFANQMDYPINLYEVL